MVGWLELQRPCDRDLLLLLSHVLLSLRHECCPCFFCICMQGALHQADSILHPAS